MQSQYKSKLGMPHRGGGGGGYRPSRKSYAVRHDFHYQPEPKDRPPKLEYSWPRKVEPWTEPQQYKLRNTSVRNELNQYDVESLHYVTGVQYEGIRVLDRMIPVKLRHQSAGSASGDINSTHKALIEIEEFGHKLLACFHIHPGTGPGSTVPSSTDREDQERHEIGGYPTIGGIFSRDRYFRAYSNNIDFNLSVYGKGAVKIRSQTLL